MSELYVPALLDKEKWDFGSFNEHCDFFSCDNSNCDICIMKNVKNYKEFMGRVVKNNIITEE